MEGYTADKVFDQVDFGQTNLETGHFEQCRFDRCVFPDLSSRKFSECVFDGCNLSLAVLTNTAFRDVAFKRCRMWGLLFHHCVKFGTSFSFEDCSLNHSSFFGTKLKGTLFKDTQLHEVDFSEADLTEAVFDNCTLTKANFHDTLLTKADLRYAFDFVIDPEYNKVAKARFSAKGLAGLLQRYGIVVDS
ncbi:pentapeptide repeat-containing protein [Dinghuibacter silviterrae]|uniref:Uncharacterized protein YjbI with pentapeptide repeats n=1 Tax=Dinghuibacter silviterrae TaxID=1539049 RepID=A0A4R8DSG6_9BACT|nr:pentapeptide repeat-containing protein [Dinghuibacter silviterrae]TDX00327.1 uncharacterized protein YjbI with pentapeptide repeats [Dinghuibacter silviterrae]